MGCFLHKVRKWPLTRKCYMQDARRSRVVDFVRFTFLPKYLGFGKDMDRKWAFRLKSPDVKRCEFSEKEERCWLEINLSRTCWEDASVVSWDLVLFLCGEWQGSFSQVYPDCWVVWALGVPGLTHGCWKSRWVDILREMESLQVGFLWLCGCGCWGGKIVHRCSIVRDHMWCLL